MNLYIKIFASKNTTIPKKEFMKAISSILNSTYYTLNFIANSLNRFVFTYGISIIFNFS